MSKPLGKIFRAVPSLVSNKLTEEESVLAKGLITEHDIDLDKIKSIKLALEDIRQGLAKLEAKYLKPLFFR